jgi:hypothetical protein
VAISLLSSGRYQVRALARNADSAPMRELAQQGAEIVVQPLEAGLSNRAGRSNARLLWRLPDDTPMSPVPPPGRPELALGVELADAALASGVEHVVWSSLENVERRTGDLLWAPHFTTKALVKLLAAHAADAQFLHPAAGTNGTPDRGHLRSRDGSVCELRVGLCARGSAEHFPAFGADE